jgi:N-formylglutamate amidohydrolase
MTTQISDEPGFVRLGPAEPETPVVLTVPHAGRDYPSALLKAARIPRAQLELLEDRHADALVERAVAAGIPAIVATRARAWIDLNRGEREIDPTAVYPALIPGTTNPSNRSESGLGLVPTRLPGGGAIFTRPIAAAELAERVERDHRPYHRAIAAALAAAHARFGVAVLIDCHSMPPLPPARAPSATIVLGDRFGRSASPAILAAIALEAQRSGLRVARNTPYAGAHTLERHGRPATGFHAIQIELDRTLYLDVKLRRPGPGLAALGGFIARAATGAADAAIASLGTAIAAE